MIALIKKIFKSKTKPIIKHKKIESNPAPSNDEVNTKSTTPTYPEDSLSSIELDHCKKLQNEQSCNSHEKFSVKNFMLKSST